MSTLDINELAKSYEASTKDFLDAVALITPANLDKTDGAGWSPRQIIHHMADSESQSAARLRRLIAEPGTQILGYDENKWSQSETLGYKTLPIENSLAVYKAARAASLELIHRLKPEQLANECMHSESGAFTLERWAIVYGKHPRDHANQLREVIAL
jgi:hypothetical protein